jgi:hypothetical protein
MANPIRLEILTNHIGYDRSSVKKAIVKGKLNSGIPEQDLDILIVDSDSGKMPFRGKASFIGPVDRWKDCMFWSLDFSGLEESGRFAIEVAVPAAPAPAAPAATSPLASTPPWLFRSAPFEVSEDVLLKRTVPAVLQYFRSQRCTGVWDDADRRAGFVGPRPDRVDVHGGWYDASGDISKYLSHLSYANYMNPQQTPMVVWCFLEARDCLSMKAAEIPTGYDSASSVLPTFRRGVTAELLKEAIYGADFLVRMQDPEGYFYIGVFDRWSKDPAQREICSFRGQAGHKLGDYQAGYRQGGGLAIAALARISSLGVAREFTAREYLQAAISGFEHLEAHNTEYLDDRRENIIDDYCALLAAAELYSAVGIHGIDEPDRFLNAARLRAVHLASRLSADDSYRGWWRADDQGERPYYHAVEAGLPVVSLLRYSDIEPEGWRREQALATVRSSLLFELAITAEVPNPFGYARQYVRPVGGAKRSAFFIPHANESGYWWQGEDARLASLAAAARLASSRLASAPLSPDTGSEEPDLVQRLGTYARDQLNWILGLNPFDACMLHGFGRNNPEYESAFPNTFGGICNGITAGFADEEDIDFLPDPYAQQGEHRWRWSEQWIPHAAWYLLAVCAG